MRKILTALTLVTALGVSTVTAFAAPVYNNEYAAPQQVVIDEATAVENYIAAQDARREYLKDLYDRGLITKSRYDLSVANIQENIDYVQENGLGTLYGGNRGYGFGGGGCGGIGCGW